MNEERQDPKAPGKRGTLLGPPPARGGRRGRGTRAADPARPCMNCGDPTPGEYCPTCGQRKVDVRVSVRVLMMDVLEDQFILDRRLPRTLNALLFRPGRLTVEYVNGRMASYIHPFRLYLVTSVLFFLLLSFFSLQLVRRGDVQVRGDGQPTASAAEVRDPAADSARLAELEAEIARLDSVLADSALPAPAASGLRLARSTVARNRDRLLAGLDRPADPAGAAAVPTAADTSTPGDSLPAEAVAPTADGAGRTVAEVLGWDDDDPTVKFPIPAVQASVTSRVRRLGAMQPREAVEELLGTFLNYVPTLMFVLLPIFALVLKLLYVRRGRYYAEHFVFLLHLHAFVFLLSTVMLLLRPHVAGWLETILFGWLLVYIYIAMKRVYGQGWLKTGVKYWILGWSYLWILAFSLPFAVIATLLLF